MDKKTKIFVFSLLSLCLLLIGCTDVGQKEDDKREIKSLRRKLEVVDSDLIDTQLSLRNAETTIHSLLTDVDQLRIQSYANKKVDKLFFNAKQSEGYRVLNSFSGQFFVSVDGVQPHLDGYKITFSFGNPYYVTYNNPKIKLRWNKHWSVVTSAPKEERKAQMDAWENSFKEKEFSLLRDLLPGSWSHIELFITPCTVEELEWVQVSIETPTIKLFDQS